MNCKMISDDTKEKKSGQEIYWYKIKEKLMIITWKEDKYA